MLLTHAITKVPDCETLPPSVIMDEPPPPQPPPLLAGVFDLNIWPAVASKPTYVYLPTGVFKVPQHYLVRDFHRPVKISNERWKTSGSILRAFCASAMLHNVAVDTRNIVVLALENHQNPHGKLKRCHWFVRIHPAAVAGDAKRQAFGPNFLWELPYEIAVEIVQEIEVCRLQYGLPAEEVSPLARELCPTPGKFLRSDFVDLKRAVELEDPHDLLFAMSVKPCKGVNPTFKEMSLPRSLSLARHPILQTERNSQIDFTNALPDDLGAKIFKLCIKRGLADPSLEGVSTLLNIRAINKSARDAVDGAASKLLTSIRTKIENTQSTHRTRHALSARTLCQKHGIEMVGFVLEARQRQKSGQPLGILSLMRLRSGRAPSSNPPKKKRSLRVASMSPEVRKRSRLMNGGW